MVKSQKTELKKAKEAIAMYLTIPKYIVMDEGFPFDRDTELQNVVVSIDYEKKALVVKRNDSTLEE